ncbi:unnamed protein product [Rotaria sp. Silwood1]|nr:unnamed protein product [Rotaria sp. Silwood1]
MNKITSSPPSSSFVGNIGKKKRDIIKYQVNNEIKKNSNIYSEDPLVKDNSLENIDNNTFHYEYIDLNQQQQPQQQQQSVQEPKQEQEEVIYDIINPNNERPVHQQTDYDSVMYATPKDV